MCNEPKVPKRICLSRIWSLLLFCRGVGGHKQPSACLSLCQNFEIPSILLKYFHPVCPCAQMYTVIQPAYWSTKYQVIFCKNIFWLADRSTTSRYILAKFGRPLPLNQNQPNMMTQPHCILLCFRSQRENIQYAYTYISRYLGTTCKLSLFATLKYANDLVYHIRNW